MAINTILPVVLGFLTVGSLAQAPMGLCTDSACGNCPNSVTTAGTGYPACVVYDRDTVLGGTAGDYEQSENSARKQVYFDIATPDNPECRYIVRSPAGPQIDKCGEPVVSSKGGLCAAPSLGIDTTFMVQFCCGSGDCGAAGIPFKRDGSSVSSGSLVLRDSADNVIIPQSVGNAAGDLMDVFMEDMGLNSSIAYKTTTDSGIPIWKIGYGAQEAEKREPKVEEPKVEKRACDSYTPNGGEYSKTGSQSYLVTARICGDGSMASTTNENSVSQTTTFGASVSDPFGIISASTEFSFEESASQSYTYTFTPPTGQCGRVSWTPFFLCTGGTINGCDAGPQEGEACTAKRINDNQLDGSYSFLISD